MFHTWRAGRSRAGAARDELEEELPRREPSGARRARLSQERRKAGKRHPSVSAACPTYIKGQRAQGRGLRAKGGGHCRGSNLWHCHCPSWQRHPHSVDTSKQVNKLSLTKPNKTHTPHTHPTHTHPTHTRLLSAFFQSFFAAASSPQVAATAAPAEDEAAPLECTHTQRCRLCVCECV